MISIKGTIIEDEIVHKVLPSEIDLFISGISLEDRCPLGCELLAKKGILPKKKLLFAFSEVLESWTRERSIEKTNFDDAIKHFSALFSLSESDCPLIVPMSDEVSGLMQFQSFFESRFTSGIDPKIIIDYSVMVKPYIYILLKYLIISQKSSKIFLIYTEPSKYNKTKALITSSERELFTKGRRDTMDIPGYSGLKNISKDKVLAILLGFEGERARDVVDDINPEVVIPINGFPAYKPEIKDLSIISNEELLKDSEIFSKLCYAPANNPFETMEVLEVIHSHYMNRYNFSIAPLGTKPMALGACLFALEHSDVRIIYPYPQEYNSKTSVGYGSSWLYVIEIRHDDESITKN